MKYVIDEICDKINEKTFLERFNSDLGGLNDKYTSNTVNFINYTKRNSTITRNKSRLWLRSKELIINEIFGLNYHNLKKEKGTNILFGY